MRAGTLKWLTLKPMARPTKNSFCYLWNFYQNHEDAEVREKSFRSFSEGLRKHQNTAAAAYLAQVKSENLGRYEGLRLSLWLSLAEQEVDRAMFDRQIDLIMKDFAPVAQRYLKHVAKVNGLEKMTFADWKLDLDSALNPEVTIDDAYDLVMKSVEPLGKNIVREVAPSRRTLGGLYLPIVVKILAVMRDPYRVHPYVLMSWTGRLSDVYTLIHEIGHSVNSSFQIITKVTSMPTCLLYYVEAPSTFNELLLSDYLEHQSDDPRQKTICPCPPLNRYLLPYFITHLLKQPSSVRFIHWLKKGKPLSKQSSTALWRKFDRFLGRCYWDWWRCSLDLDAKLTTTWACIATPTLLD